MEALTYSKDVQLKALREFQAAVWHDLKYSPMLGVFNRHVRFLANVIEYETEEVILSTFGILEELYFEMKNDYIASHGK